MCGISLVLCSCNDDRHKTIEERLARRGPDMQICVEQRLADAVTGYFTGCVLHLQGSPTPQPVLDKDGNVLLWNGEIFGGIEVDARENDTDVLHSRLGGCETDNELLDVMRQIQGPWAFIYWQEKQNNLWFGRDIFGRRSLLLNHSQGSSEICLSSIKLDQYGEDWQEIPAAGIYKISITPETLISNISLFAGVNDSGVNSVRTVLYPYVSPSVSFGHAASHNVDSSIEMKDVSKASNFLNESSEVFIHTSLREFNDTVPDADQSEALKLLANENLPIDSTQSILDLSTAEDHKLAEEFINIFGNAIKTRIERQPVLCSNCIKKQMVVNPASGDNSSDNMTVRLNMSHEEKCRHSRVAILFSGGIDSIMITALADRYVDKNEPIDLLNVAFERQSKQQKQKHGERTPESDQFIVPDRITGLSGLQELQKINPNRSWNFVKVNVTKAELQERRERQIRDLVHPLCSVLDDSIGCAIWFAAKGHGILHSDNPGEPIEYVSPARVILVGMGADEQLAGYSRHRGKFNTGGWSGLVQEIKMEVQRISARNLGRDDRIITDHGRESRFPFLDENVVSFLNKLPVWKKANLHLPRGLGEKFLLRLSALKVGLSDSAILAKRAIQFGSRIAKLENNKEKASDTCSRLANNLK
ncbi:unnamed protein product [Owenia fusiformis]|uniref:Uncharacterized protein n=1 Tax=Owenia fusiformis TaxID=6347 RepID=A0A8J1Y4Z1_OWEFU|nr:unnamed protein product [Owenia fusiformis]